MSAAVDIVVQINSAWRVVLTHDQAAYRRKAWLVQKQLADGAWCTEAVVRSVPMLREMVQAWAGAVDADAVPILAALPPRVDIGQEPETETVSKTGVVYRNRILKTPAAPKAKIPAMASRDCVTCGSTFTYPARASRTLTCSPKCSQANQRARRRDLAQQRSAVEAGEIAAVQAPPPPEAMERAPQTDDAIAAYFWQYHRVRLPATAD